MFLVSLVVELLWCSFPEVRIRKETEIGLVLSRLDLSCHVYLSVDTFPRSRTPVLSLNVKNGLPSGVSMSLSVIWCPSSMSIWVSHCFSVSLGAESLLQANLPLLQFFKGSALVIRYLHHLYNFRSSILNYWAASFVPEHRTLTKDKKKTFFRLYSSSHWWIAPRKRLRGAIPW